MKGISEAPNLPNALEYPNLYCKCILLYTLLFETRLDNFQMCKDTLTRMHFLYKIYMVIIISYLCKNKTYDKWFRSI